MKALVLTAALTCTAGTASALCEDAWYLRNMAFDRAGYCFGSALGKSVFSAECSTKSPSLNDWDQRMVSAHKQLEASYSCKIDTKGRHLASSLIGKLDDIDLLPTLSQFESSCVGYTGAPVTLTSGIGTRDSYPIGTIEGGATVYFRFEPWGGFEFVETKTGAGWIPEGSVDPHDCTAFAG